MSDRLNKRSMDSYITRIKVQDEMLRLLQTENEHLKMAIGHLLELKDELLRHYSDIHFADPQILQSLLFLDHLFRSQSKMFTFVPENLRNFTNFTAVDLSTGQNTQYNTVEHEIHNVSLSNLKLIISNSGTSSSTASLSNAKAVSNEVGHFESNVDKRNMNLHNYACKATQNVQNDGNLVFIDQDLRNEAQLIAEMEIQQKNLELKPELKMDQEEEAYKYCICKKETTGEMICCDNQNCPNGIWFHFACVGITSQLNLNDEWFCPGCTKNLRIIQQEHKNGNKFGKRSSLIQQQAPTHKLHRCLWIGCSYFSTNRWNVVRHVRTCHFNLPQTLAEQSRRNIVDTRDPADYIQIEYKPDN